MVFYAKDYNEYWPSFFEAELQNNVKNAKLAKIHTILQDEQEKGIIFVYIHFASVISKEFFIPLIFLNKKKCQFFNILILIYNQIELHLILACYLKILF